MPMLLCGKNVHCPYLRTEWDDVAAPVRQAVLLSAHLYRNDQERAHDRHRGRAAGLLLH